MEAGSPELSPLLIPRKRTKQYTDENLIGLVEKRPVLWNKNHMHYKNRSAREYAWKAIAKEFTGYGDKQIEGTRCEIDWNRMYRSRCKVKSDQKRFRLQSGSSPQKNPVPDYKHEQLMKFLDINQIDRTLRVGNMSPVPEDEEMNESQEHLRTPFQEVGNSSRANAEQTSSHTRKRPSVKDNNNRKKKSPYKSIITYSSIHRNDQTPQASHVIDPPSPGRSLGSKSPVPSTSFTPGEKNFSPSRNLNQQPEKENHSNPKNCQKSKVISRPIATVQQTPQTSHVIDPPSSGRSPGAKSPVPSSSFTTGEKNFSPSRNHNHQPEKENQSKKKNCQKSKVIRQPIGTVQRTPPISPAHSTGCWSPAGSMRASSPVLSQMGGSVCGESNRRNVSFEEPRRQTSMIFEDEVPETRRERAQRIKEARAAMYTERQKERVQQLRDKVREQEQQRRQRENAQRDRRATVNNPESADGMSWFELELLKNIETMNATDEHDHFCMMMAPRLRRLPRDMASDLERSYLNQLIEKENVFEAMNRTLD